MATVQRIFGWFRKFIVRLFREAIKASPEVFAGAGVATGKPATWQEKIDYSGLWWLPEKPDKQVAGRLEFTPGSRMVLNLLDTMEEGQFENQGRWV